MAVPTFENTNNGKGKGYKYGVDREFMQDAKNIWVHEYDWSAFP